jgi:hypothetical protein
MLDIVNILSKFDIRDIWGVGSFPAFNWFVVIILIHHLLFLYFKSGGDSSDLFRDFLRTKCSIAAIMSLY